MRYLNNIGLLVAACFFWGLAPLFPEPHIIGKVRWILGGAKDMQKIDWLDFGWHALPFLLLIRAIIVYFKKRNADRA